MKVWVVGVGYVPAVDAATWAAAGFTVYDYWKAAGGS